ncbi:hypothetical protein [Sphingomonas sp.]
MLFVSIIPHMDKEYNWRLIAMDNDSNIIATSEQKYRNQSDAAAACEQFKDRIAEALAA